MITSCGFPLPLRAKRLYTSYETKGVVVSSCEYTSCWRMRSNKTQETPCIPTKSYACMSTPWSLGNLYTAAMQRRRESSRRFKMGTYQPRENTLTEKHRSSKISVGLRRVANLIQNILFIAKSEEEGQGPHRAVEPMMMMTMCAYTSIWDISVCSLISCYACKLFERNILL
jgi:hypothetical protein